MAFHAALDWHSGENLAHKLTGVDRMVGDNPTSPFLTPRAAHMVQRYPLMALGTLDDSDQPWVSVWGGEAPFAQQVARSVLGIRTLVDADYDPVVQALFRGKTDGEVLKEEGPGRLVAGLSILLEERGRVKLAGRVVGGACSRHESEDGDQGKEEGKGGGRAGEVQLVLKIEQSLGNCPKYLNRKTITPAVPEPKLVEEGPKLGSGARKLIDKADLFFVASAHEHEDMDANHRGGPQGFIRVHDTDEASEIIWPEYSGNNLYQTLGNLMATPKAGLCIPDFETGDVLYVTGTAEVLVGKAASDVLAKTKLAVRLRITDSKLVTQGLPFRGTNMPDAQEGRSPYNPRVRYLTSEKAEEFAAGTAAPVTASLIKKAQLTPTITRYRFSLSDPLVLGPWKPGQYVALDFSSELDMGYSHMRDDDPGSLNDDFMRTFTVSSVPGALGTHGEEFEITVRRVGSATGWLSWQREGRIEVGVRGFGGEFRFDMPPDEPKKRVAFIAAGIGITPLLGQMGALDLPRVRVLWSVGIKDVGLVSDIVKQFPNLKSQLTVFLTGDDAALDDDDDEARKQLAELQASGSDVKIERRRLLKDDLAALEGDVDDWYLCTAPAMRQVIQSWLPEKSFVFENFNY